MISLSPTHELLAMLSDNYASFYVKQSELNIVFMWAAVLYCAQKYIDNQIPDLRRMIILC